MMSGLPLVVEEILKAMTVYLKLKSALLHSSNCVDPDNYYDSVGAVVSLLKLLKYTLPLVDSVVTITGGWVEWLCLVERCVVRLDDTFQLLITSYSPRSKIPDLTA
ncbi:hypothetical protein OTU49_014097 [Cherax quadricarinatus]|uniref:Uncharacterized protein n=1 Tax=Cherax quadricarinatus TaxID=27406 RepID=A0AAW0VR01_CHEQU